MLNWDNGKVFAALRKLGLEVLDGAGTPLRNRKVHLYPQGRPEVAVLYAPEGDYKLRPLAFFVGGSDDWREDVYEVIREFVPAERLKPKLKNGRPKWVECNMPPEGWARLAQVLGLDGASGTAEFERLPKSLRSHFTPERDTPTTATRVASVAEVRQNHGVVTNKLEELLRLSVQATANDKRQDLLIVEDGKMMALFEVKSDSSLQSVYTAIGQLMYHGSATETPPIRIAVLPETVTREAEERLERLGISLVTFRMVEGIPLFNGLDAILQRLGVE